MQELFFKQPDQNNSRFEECKRRRFREDAIGGTWEG
jgi:hypothetical protein